jgi:hypothetical protein
MKTYIFLTLIVFGFLSSCTHDSDITDTPQGVTENVTSNTWKVGYYFDNVDETSHFSGYIFTFDQNGTLTASNGSLSYSGTWASYTDDSTLKLELLFASPEYFQDISDDWHVVQQSESTIELQDVSGGDGSTKYLTFTKN